MADAPSKKMYRVELFIEVPDTISAPTEWNWDNMVNGPDLTEEQKTPVRFVLANEVQEGTA